MDVTLFLKKIYASVASFAMPVRGQRRPFDLFCYENHFVNYFLLNSGKKSVASALFIIIISTV